MNDYTNNFNRVHLNLQFSSADYPNVDLKNLDLSKILSEKISILNFQNSVIELLVKEHLRLNLPLINGMICCQECTYKQAMNVYDILKNVNLPVSKEANELLTISSKIEELKKNYSLTGHQAADKKTVAERVRAESNARNNSHVESYTHPETYSADEYWYEVRGANARRYDYI